jgi:hypothetical protein
LEDCGRRFEGFVFRLVQAQLKSELDAAVSYDARRAEGDVAETVLTVHERRNHEDRTLIPQDRLTDPRDAGCNGEARIAFEDGDLGTGVAHAGEELFLARESIDSRVER